MTNLEELIEMANTLSQRLEQAANDEKKFSYALQLIFENMSWEQMRLANEITEIKNYL